MIKYIDPVYIVIDDEIYEPSDDSVLLASVLQSEICREFKNVLLEIGCGCGYIALSILKHCIDEYNPSYAILIDISPCAIESAKESAKLNNLYAYIDVVQCDSASCIRSKSIDVVFFNPPYLPINSIQKWIDYAWSGGRGGISVWKKFFSNAVRICIEKNCDIIFVLSSLQDTHHIFDTLMNKCEYVEIAKCKYFFFEAICVVKTRCMNNAKSSSCRY